MSRPVFRLDKIVQVVREGQGRKAPIERIADVITGYFVPVITLLAIVTWMVWLALGLSGSLPSRYLDLDTGGWRECLIVLFQLLSSRLVSSLVIAVRDRRVRCRLPLWHRFSRPNCIACRLRCRSSLRYPCTWRWGSLSRDVPSRPYCLRQDGNSHRRWFSSGLRL